MSQPLLPQVPPYFNAQPNSPNLIQVSGAPSTAAVSNLLGTLAVDPATGTYYGQVTNNGTTATWAILGGGTGAIATLTGDSGTATPVAGNVKIAGTANQITTAGSGATITLTLPSAITAPGSLLTTTTLAATTTVTGGTGVIATTGNISATAGAVHAGTSITATLGAITATNGNLVFGTAGNKILSTSVASTITAGANSFGSVTLVSGKAVVSTSAVTAASLIVTWRQSIGSTGANPVGILYTSNISAGASFEIHAGLVSSMTTDVSTDVSVIGWMLIN